MPTPPFPADLVDRLSDPTAWEFNSTIGEVFTPRFFCCDDPNSLGISDGKAPVAIIGLSPSPAYVSENVLFTGTASYDPDGSITAYAWTFEDGTPATGTVASGTVTWGTAGVYTVELTVTDGTGLQSTPARVQINIQPVEFAAYLASSSGVYYSDTLPPSWTAKNTGLSGNDLIVYDVKIDPATQNLAAAEKVVWRCGRGGIQVSDDAGSTWTEKNPASVADTWSDTPDPAISDLTFRQLLWAGDRLYVLADWQNGSSAWRSTIFYTDDAGAMRGDTSGSVTWTEVTI